MKKIRKEISVYSNQDLEEDADLFIHDCILDKICISNQCSNPQKLCCNECIQFYHPNHPEKIQDYIFSYKSLKRSIKDKKINLNKRIKVVQDLKTKHQIERKQLLSKVNASFDKIDSYCSNLVAIEVKSLQKKFDSIFDSNSFQVLKDITQSALSTEQQQQQLKLIEYANKIFCQFESETHPYLQFKSKHENDFIEETNNHLQEINDHLTDINLKFKRYSDKFYKASKMITQTHLINYKRCEIDSKKIEYYETPISQLIVLNYHILIISLRINVPRQVLCFIDYTNNYEQVNTLYIPHDHVVNLKSRGTFLVINEYKITKIRYSPRKIYMIKSLMFIERILKVEFISEMNSIIVITKSTDINNQNIKFNFYRVSDMYLFKRYMMQDSPKSILLASSFSTNTLVTANQRHLKIYSLISGKFERFYVIGDTLNDDIIDIRFQNQFQYGKKDQLIVSNVQGLVTKIGFPHKRKIIVNKKNTNDQISFCIFEQMKLFTDKRYIQFTVSPKNTLVKVVKIKKNQNKKQSESVDQFYQLEEEYTCHASCNYINFPSVYHLFIGTALGSLFHISYQNQQN